jgi:hypothetical protein
MKQYSWVKGSKLAKGVIIRLDRMIQMGCPLALKVPQDWGIRGLIRTNSAISLSIQSQ